MTGQDKGTDMKVKVTAQNYWQVKVLTLRDRAREGGNLQTDESVDGTFS